MAALRPNHSSYGVLVSTDDLPVLLMYGSNVDICLRKNSECILEVERYIGSWEESTQDFPVMKYQ